MKLCRKMLHLGGVNAFQVAAAVILVYLLFIVNLGKNQIHMYMTLLDR